MLASTRSRARGRAEQEHHVRVRWRDWGRLEERKGAEQDGDGARGERAAAATAHRAAQPDADGGRASAGGNPTDRGRRSSRAPEAAGRTPRGAGA
eukprot:365135-Rhodomonas_salina.2